VCIQNCQKCNCTIDKYWKQKEKGPSPTDFPMFKDYSLKKIETSSEHLNSKYYNLCIYLIMVAILLIGSTFERTFALFNILDINTGSKQFYHNTVILDVEKTINSLLKEFLECNRTQIKNKVDIYLMLDVSGIILIGGQENVLL
jgi:hypothetical protein